MVTGCSTVQTPPLYFLTLVAFELKLIYDRMVQAPGHGKCITDTVNGMDKSYLDKCINTITSILNSEENTKVGVKRKRIVTVAEISIQESLAD